LVGWVPNENGHIHKRTGFDNHTLKCYRKVSSADGGSVIVIYLKGGKNEAVKRKYQMKHIEKLILKETEGLPPHALNEVLDFIQFIKEKKLKQNGDDIFKSNLELELSLLDKKELTHLEEEFKDYKELYPHEK